MRTPNQYSLKPSTLYFAAAIAALAVLPAVAQEVPPQAPATTPARKNQKVIPLAEVTVTAKRLMLLGTAQTASDGVVSKEELELTPAYRPGQLLETVPGLIVTIHSGEGKANQYLARGYNLDHGTDLATFIDGVPINQPTHAHGQGYTDLNFMIPELADQLTYTKGTYHADVGDFGAVASVRLSYLDTIPDQASITTGAYNFQRLLTAGTRTVAGGNLLAALELQHYDGPFVVPDDQRKENLFLRYSRGDDDRGYSLTGTFYHGLSTNTTDIPIRALAEGLVPNRFGSLDGSDGVRADRGNLSWQYHQFFGDALFTANTYYSHNQLRLFNNFTHFLVDPVNGDQEDQHEFRNTEGGEARYTLPAQLLSFDNELEFGLATRGDELAVGRTPSTRRVPLTPAQVPNDPASFSNQDQVELLTLSPFIQATTHWTAQFRTVFGFRDDYARGSDDDQLASLHESANNGNLPYTNTGNARRNLPQPKGSLIYEPNQYAEFYLSAGRGFHSADIRGVNQTRSLDLNLPGTPLLASQEGEEFGVRAQPLKSVTLTFAVFNLDQSSETIIDPDIGSDAAGPPSRRTGYEVNLSYKINRWLEFYGSYSGDHTRFKYNFDDGTGHLGHYITDAPVYSGSLALYLANLGPWSGGLEYRFLGDYPLTAGPCADAAVVHDFPNSGGAPGIPAPNCAYAVSNAYILTGTGQLGARGFGELNMDATYRFRDGWSATVLAYNLLNSKANAASFTYNDRLLSEVNEFPDGRADTHIHPLEDIAARFTLTRTFGLF